MFSTNTASCHTRFVRHCHAPAIQTRVCWQKNSLHSSVSQYNHASVQPPSISHKTLIMYLLLQQETQSKPTWLGSPPPSPSWSGNCTTVWPWRGPDSERGATWFHTDGSEAVQWKPHFQYCFQYVDFGFCLTFFLCVYIRWLRIWMPFTTLTSVVSFSETGSLQCKDQKRKVMLGSVIYIKFERGSL